MHGTLDESHPKPTRDQFVDNFIKLKEQEKALMEVRRDKGRNDQKAHHESQIVNLKSILIRQLTTGIFREPKPQYLKKLTDKRVIENELARTTGSAIRDPDQGKLIIDITFSSLMSDLKTN